MERSGRVVPGRDRSGSKKKEPAQADLKNEKQPVEESDQAKVERENTEKKTETGEQPTQEKLFDAVKRGDTKAVEELLTTGGFVDCRDNMERTPLMEAAEGGHAEVVELLLNRGANVNAVDVDGETAAITATYADHLDVLKILHSHGADLEIRNEQGRTALDIVKDGGSNALASYLGAQSSQGQDGMKNETSTDPDDDDPDPDDPVGASATGAMLLEPDTESDIAQDYGAGGTTASPGAARATASTGLLTPEQEAVGDEIAASLAQRPRSSKPTRRESNLTLWTTNRSEASMKRSYGFSTRQDLKLVTTS